MTARHALAAAVVLLITAFVAPTLDAGPPRLAPDAAGLDAARFAHIDALVEKGIAERKMPGAVVLIGRRAGVVFERAYGHRRLEPSPEPMTLDTVFDMASITKPVATGTSVMILLEQGKIRLRDRVANIYIPEFANNGKETITVRDLLTHQAGFIPDNALADYKQGRTQSFENIYNLDLRYEPRTKFVYSDVGFILAGDLIERLSGERQDVFVQRHLFEPLAMHDTGFLPPERLRERTATTEQRNGEWMRGEVHDPRAYLMDGVAGHAGLFSTADDLAIYATMMLNGGVYQNTRILAESTVRLMTEDVVINERDRVTRRALGWDKRSAYSSNRGENFSTRAFGHGGFTGTAMWIDPELDLYVIFLSNRVHPNGKGSVNHIAGRVATVAAGALESPSRSDPARTSRNTRVRTGLDVLRETEFEALRGKRIGLITNHTGVDEHGVSNIRLFHDSPNVDLRAIFSPEHGIRGILDVSNIADSEDTLTGLEVFSLYGETREPTSEQLAHIDTIVFDIQDIGCRFYTYISTMGLAMRAAAKHDKDFVVLDRPNPINGVDVSGPVLDAGRESFVGYHTIPIRHGMTVGELATLFANEFDLPDTWNGLRVVRMQGWERDTLYDETGLAWVNPSPNMRNLNQALLYPGIGLLETTNLSVGRGTDTPFELFGAPWIDARKLANALNLANTPGVRFTPRSFVPKSSKFATETCGGVQISIVDRTAIEPMRIGIEVATTLRRLYPNQWETDRYMRLLGNQSAFDAVIDATAVDEIIEAHEADLRDFRQRRNQALLY